MTWFYPFFAAGKTRGSIALPRENRATAKQRLLHIEQIGYRKMFGSSQLLVYNTQCGKRMFVERVTCGQRT